MNLPSLLEEQKKCGSALKKDEWLNSLRRDTLCSTKMGFKEAAAKPKQWHFEKPDVVKCKTLWLNLTFEYLTTIQNLMENSLWYGLQKRTI